MPTIVFENCVVAFLDIIGFKAIVEKAPNDPEALNALDELVRLLSEAVPSFNKDVSPSVPKNAIPKHTYISDSIILSAPISVYNGKLLYSGIETVVLRVIQLAHYFLRKGYLLRGGIAVGSVWHTDNNIVGPAYQEAYKIESDTDQPCVILSEQAAEMWRTSRLKQSRMCVIKPQTCKCCKPKVMVHALCGECIPNWGEYGVIEERYEQYSNLITKRLKSELPCKAIKKWKWFNEYLQAERIDRKWPAP